ncbi:MAG: acyl-CoA/acyl-ACP dehydrogenase [Burkholderiales bacterium]|nr:acyl-CoA/acyl-ACP dehydrogenase [Burkholderiales bacterium]
MSGTTDIPESEPAERAERISMLRESAGRFCAAGEHVKRSRKLRGSVPGFDREVWKQMAGMGWTGILIPGRFGGLGLGSMEMAAVAESLGRYLLPEPLVASTMLGAGAILYGENETIKKKILPAVVSGDVIPALAWREAGHNGDILAASAQAVSSREGIRLSGRKHLVVGGMEADGFVVSARNDHGLCLYWVPGEAATAGLAPVELADGRSAATLDLSGLRVPGENRIAGPGRAEEALSRAFDEALFATSAELLGVISSAFAITLDYLKTRKQFGKLIGCYQALQHRAVDLYAAEVTCRCALDEVLAEAGAPDIRAQPRGALASRIKARCSRASLVVTREAVQLHGAIGISDECDIGLFLKRAITLSAWLGGADFHRARYAELADEEAAHA